MAEGFAFACPACRAPLERVSPELYRCPQDGAGYACIQGIWRFLPESRQADLHQFLVEYEAVRSAEERGSPDPAYYHALPFADLSGKRPADWRIRSKSFRVFVERVLVPLERLAGRPLKCLDLGAGNAWLSYRLAQRGHAVAAVDLFVNAWDGLGAQVHYPVSFHSIQAEFDRLPLCDAQVDLVVFNASFHYSVDYEVTLAEALRVLLPRGKVVILDTPLYHQESSGVQMVRERQAEFRQRYGFPSDALPSENFLTAARLSELEGALGLRWQTIRPFYGLRWALRPWLAFLRRRREPARFLVLIGQRRYPPAWSKRCSAVARPS